MNMKDIVRSLLVVAMVVLLCGGLATRTWAQSPTAQIRGMVVDAQGLPVVGAQLTANNELTGASFKTQSNELGLYVLRALPIGRYLLSVEVSGFKRYSRSGISLSVGQVARVNVELEVGNVVETVTVSSDVSPVDTSTSTLSTLVDQQRMNDLPLNGRNILDLAVLMPGTTRVTGALGGYMGSQEINVNGNRAFSTNVTLDNAGMYNGHRGQALVQPPPDAIQEVKITSSGLGAEYARGAAEISVITKSGTNEYHGSLWNYLRNDVLDARSFFASTVPKLRYNQFGGTLGGRIIRNKAFFFASFERLEIRQDQLRTNAFPPTALERKGDFSQTRDDPPIDPLTNAPFPDGVIPPSRIEPIAAKLLERFPLPNQADGSYRVQVSAATQRTMIMGRGDYDWRPGSRTNVRYYRNPSTRDLPFPAGSNIDGYSPAFTKGKVYNVNVGHTHTFTPKLLLDARFGVSRYDSVGENSVRESLESLGAKFISAGGPPALPMLSISGRMTAASEREGNRGPSKFFDGAANLSWFGGKHEVKFGGSHARMKYGEIGRAESQGNFDFSGDFTKNSMADFLIGQASGLEMEAYAERAAVYHNVGLFVKDTWQVTRRLSLDLGLRWEFYTPWREMNGDWHAFVPGARSQFIPAAPVGTIYDRDEEFPHTRDFFNVGPRIGFAYDVFGNGKTSIRGGYGITYEPLIGQFAIQPAQPFGGVLHTTDVGPLSDPQRFVDVPFGKPVDLVNPTFTLPITMKNSVTGEMRQTYSQNLNFTIEHEIVRDTLLRASYVGTLGRRLGIAREINLAPYIPGQSTRKNTDARRKYAPTYASLRGLETTGLSNYHALQLMVKRRFASGYSIQVGYSWAKAIDEANTGVAANSWTAQDPENRRGSRSLGNYDHRHRLVASWIWEIPFLREQNNILEKIVGGWNFAGIGIIQSGSPFNVTSGRDISLRGVNKDRPDVLGDPRLPTDRPTSQLLQQYFDTSMFVFNQEGQYGNAGRNFLIGPGDINFDLSLQKGISLTESKRLELRWDVFNAFNRANFSNPASKLSSKGSFGRITGSGAGRIMQLALRFEF